METAITGRAPAQLSGTPLSVQAASGSSAFAVLFAGTAALAERKPAEENGPENALPSAEQVMEAIESHPEAINALIKKQPELEEALIYIAELVLDEQGGETPVPEDALEEMPPEKDSMLTKLAIVVNSPNAEALANKHAGVSEKQPEALGNTKEERAVKAALPVLEQLTAKLKILPPGDQQAIQMEAEKLQQAVGQLVSETLAGNEKGQAEDSFTNRLNELTALLSKVLPENSGKARLEAALIAAAVADEAPVQPDGTKGKMEGVRPEWSTPRKDISRIEKLEILFPEKPPEVQQLISYLEQHSGAERSAGPHPQWLPQVPAGWMSPPAGQEARAATGLQSLKQDLQQWQKYINGREEPGSWVPKALQPSGEQPEKLLTAFVHSLQALIKKQPSVSLTAEAGNNEAFAEQLERILQSIRGETGNASATPVPPAGVGEPRASQLNGPLVIQLPPASEGNQRQAEFLRQFQQTLSTMNAAQLKNGASYTIRLHPEHLGRLDVKLTKIEGQWTAQLVTTSKGAQELVESSVHQLRHSFLQQNLQVERIEVAEHPDFYKEEEQKEEPEEQREAVNVQEESSEEEERSFEDILQQLSVNERI
ncbi:flagellar hook-length control protein FliK [Marinococcus halophilus]|uniref:Flagellar hook-length control protein-like C-terminal domain-containing protein n=1 Tax=Marinococcus halophilus TaxID=1371 RepID=A0A510Y4B8_MARHA|nr:flagellar hook-length control protein FliK [Marinococcus halophilus]GEK57397.1 hypothetical protein MHA01_03020 [Marinococcus halophilus]